MFISNVYFLLNGQHSLLQLVLLFGMSTTYRLMYVKPVCNVMSSYAGMLMIFNKKQMSNSLYRTQYYMSCTTLQF